MEMATGRWPFLFGAVFCFLHALFILGEMQNGKQGTVSEER